jgi:hypothetical protein
MKIAAVLLALAALTAVAAPAVASDRSVKRAWDADDAEFERHGERFERLYRQWRRSGFASKTRAVLRELAATRNTLDGTRAAVRGETASSEKGKKARYWALRSMRVFDEELATAQRGIRACSNGKRRRGTRLFAEANELSDRSHRFARRAKRLFREALT